MDTTGVLARITGNTKSVNKLGNLKLEISKLTELSKGQIFSQTKGMNIEDVRYIMSICRDAVATGKKKNWGHAWNSEMVRVWKPKVIHTP